jgi:cyclic pyranopterin phosphate synthase
LSKKIFDPFGREVNYLRLSVTEHCNLNCFYCSSNPGECVAGSRRELLTPESITVIGQAAVELGITKIRLTGGEPLVRPDIVEIVRRLANIEGLKDLSLTTNGILLEGLASRLADAGLKRVNISLDSLDEGNFKKITNGGKIKNTLDGIKKSLQVGLTPVKINMVLLKGINDHEIERFVRLTLDQDLDVRFIEYMPVQGQKGAWSTHFLPLQRVLDAASNIAPLTDIEGEHGGPAKYYRLEGAVGKIGLISPLSRHFCNECNRLRVISEGKIKPCLFSEEAVDLLPYLNNKELIKEKYKEAIRLKPDPQGVACDPSERVEQFKEKRSMTKIGG